MRMSNHASHSSQHAQSRARARLCFPSSCLFGDFDSAGGIAPGQGAFPNAGSGYHPSAAFHPWNGPFNGPFNGPAGLPMFKKKIARLRRSRVSSRNTHVTSIENLKNMHNVATSNKKHQKKSHKGPPKDTKVQVSVQKGKPDKARFLASSATLIKSRQEQSHAINRGRKHRAHAPSNKHQKGRKRKGNSGVQEALNSRFRMSRKTQHTHHDSLSASDRITRHQSRH